MTKLINIEQLTVQLQDKTVLSEVELSLDKGDILGLVGPSGCGKTTLLNTLAGFIEQDLGEIHIQGREQLQITVQRPVSPEKRNIGMIFQDYALFPHLTVTDNICFGISKLAKSEQLIRSDELLTLLELSDLAKRYPHQLSGGQQQRVAIARALAAQPDLLLLDEPFSNIDARLRNELMIEIRQLLKRLNMTAIFVTHNKDEVFMFADKIAVMDAGQVLQVGTPTDVCKTPNCWQVADFLQLGSWLPATLSKDKTQYITALGDIAITHCVNTENDVMPDQSTTYQLLVKSHDLTVVKHDKPNVIVEHISVTEQGYHYLLRSIENNYGYKFTQLSFYSAEIFVLSDKLKATINTQSLLVYHG